MQTSFSINIMRHYTLWAIVRGFSNPYISGSRGKDLLIFPAVAVKACYSAVASQCVDAGELFTQSA